MKNALAPLIRPESPGRTPSCSRASYPRCFGVSQHLPNDHSDNGRADQEYLLDLLHAEESVQRLLHRQLIFKEVLAVLIRSLGLFPALLVLVAMVFIVGVGAKGRREGLDVLRAQSFGSDVLFAAELDTDQALGGHNCRGSVAM